MVNRQVSYVLAQWSCNMCDSDIISIEVYLLIQQSLRNRVASLDDDRWMYETEDDIRV
jgi:hypothetical protein